MAGGFTKIPKLQVEDLGTEGTGDRIGLFNSAGELVGYMMATDGFIPLSGTEEGKPITGDLEFKPYIGKGKIVSYDLDQDIESYYMPDYDLDGGGGGFYYRRGLNETSFLYGQDKISLTSTNVDFQGITSGSFFNKENNPTTFAQLGDIATTNATVSPLSLSDLNTAYGTQGTGFKVICPALNLIYIKSSLTTWEQFTTTTVI